MPTATSAPPSESPAAPSPVPPPTIAGSPVSSQSIPAPPPSSGVSIAPRSFPRWVHDLAYRLSERGATPQTLDFAGLGAAGVAAAFLPIGGLVESGVGTTALVLAAVCIQVRFLCGLLADCLGGPRRRAFMDGVPDLVADAVVAASAGFAASATVAGPILGSAAAFLGLLLAHVRLVDGCASAPGWAAFARPRNRMAVITAACVLGAILPYGWQQLLFLLALLGSAAVCGAVVWFRVTRRAHRA